MFKFLAGCCVFLLAGLYTAAQDTLSRPPQDTVSIVNQIHSDRLRFKKIDSVTQLQMLAGHVELQQDNTKFYCDSAVINKHLNILEAFGNVHINDADSIQTYGQYLIYHIDTKTAVLKKKVKLTDGKGILTTEELQYDTRAKTGVYTTGGKIINGTTVITSKEATYYGDLNDVYFKKNVVMHDPAYDLTTDSLLYNTDSKIATFITKTFIKDSSGANIVTTDGFYDMTNRRASFGKRSVVNDGKGITVVGDDIRTDDSTGQTLITGNAVYIDTVQKISVLSNSMLADKKKKTFLATQHPLMIIQQDKDSLYISADTMYSARIADIRDSAFRDLPNVPEQLQPSPTLKKDSVQARMSRLRRDTSLQAKTVILQKDTIKTTTVVNAGDTSDIRYFQCFHHVRIFSDSLQAVCDSLFYSARDSVFRLFTTPIIWASGSQVTGDTIYLFTKNKKADRMFAYENGFAINKSGENMFNQISGKTINGYFKDGAIDYMRSRGSPAQSIYYVRDESQAIVGVNNAIGDVIDMRFLNKELNKVVFVRDVKGTLYPFRQTPADKKLLRNFKWQDDKRPKTKFELFEN
jgi:lipopolysaccharide export system protein LptA